MITMKKLTSIALAAAMAMSLAVPAMAADSPNKGPTPVVVHRYENRKFVGQESYGAWKEIVRGPGNNQGHLTATTTQEYSVTCNVTLMQQVIEGLESALGFSVTQTFSISGEYDIVVPRGEVWAIIYRPRGDKYTVDQVTYQIVAGKEKELNREKITVYVPQSIEFNQKKVS